MDQYKTIFIEAEIIKATMKMKYEPNGDQLARDVQATLIEMADKGYELFSTDSVTSNHQSTYSHTSGMVLIFKKTPSPNH